MNHRPTNDLAIFCAALELKDTAERQVFLEAECGGDAALRRKIDELLASAELGSDELDRFGGRGTFNLRGVERPGDLIGRYRLIQEIGEGGGGRVYLAEQEQPLRRRVALKIIKAGMDTRGVITRFEGERQALALMDHPNIAKVFDVGSTETGRPYFVMELVEGQKIPAYCAEHKLPIKERLDLFLQVCDAVQHAHQKGIIHRDLKPTNILVSEKNGAPTVKVIDFGIAKAIEGKLTDATIHTSLHQFIGTPAYMSPEQADLSPDIDTRADIYSLGVLLYELLTGKAPFDNHELLTVGLDEMRRIIREVEPKRPSQSPVAANVKRQILKSAFGTPHSEIPSDLDWIVMKCLEKDRSRRYESANALASDIQRHLNNEPVIARSQTAGYRLQKFIRRHQTVALAVALISTSVLVAAITSSIALVRERAANGRERVAREQADQQLRSALRFVDEVFKEVAPQLRQVPGAVVAQEKLGKAVLTLLDNVRGSAGTNAEIREAVAMGLLYLSMIQGNIGEGSTLGHYKSALEHGREAENLFLHFRPSELSAKDLELLARAKQVISSALRGSGRFEEAAAVLSQSQPLLARLEKFPEHQKWAQTRRYADLADGGFCLMLAGYPGNALTNYLLPVITSEWARSITTNSADHWDLEVLATTYGQLSVVYEMLNDFPAMTQAAATGMRYQQALLHHSPENSRNRGLMAAFHAVHGHGLMRTGSTNESIQNLNLSRAEIEELVRLDPENEFARYWRTEITATQARVFRIWSALHNPSRNEREQRLLAAQSYLAESEEFGRPLKGKPRLPALSAARTEIDAARGRLANAHVTEREQSAPANKP